MALQQLATSGRLNAPGLRCAAISLQPVYKRLHHMLFAKPPACVPSSSFYPTCPLLLLLPTDAGWHEVDGAAGPAAAAGQDCT